MADPRLAAAVRLVHVLAMAVVVGGSAALWATLRRATAEETPRPSGLYRYERWFWASAGLLVLTGVGNVGALGDAFPRFDTARGVGFAAKFALVGAFLLASAIRTFVVARLVATDAPLGEVARRGLSGWYRTTALVGGGIAGLGVLLAHGGF